VAEAWASLLEGVFCPTSTIENRPSASMWERDEEEKLCSWRKWTKVGMGKVTGNFESKIDRSLVVDEDLGNAGI